jgi:NADH-quinone oxidoreductase subunit M
LEKASLAHMPDLSAREIALLAPLALLTIYYGVRPGPILTTTAASVTELVRGFDAALAVTKTAALALH